MKTLNTLLFIVCLTATNYQASLLLWLLGPVLVCIWMTRCLMIVIELVTALVGGWTGEPGQYTRSISWWSREQGSKRCLLWSLFKILLGALIRDGETRGFPVMTSDSVIRRSQDYTHCLDVFQMTSNILCTRVSCNTPQQPH